MPTINYSPENRCVMMPNAHILTNLSILRTKNTRTQTRNIKKYDSFRLKAYNWGGRGTKKKTEENIIIRDAKNQKEKKNIDHITHLYEHFPKYKKNLTQEKVRGKK